MTTTIAVKESTLRLLKDLKDEDELESLDEVIEELIKERKRVPGSMAGAFPRLKKLSAEEEGEFDEL